MNLNFSCRGLVLAGVLALCWPASSQTLEEAMAMAYENSPMLEAARAELRSTDELISQAYSAYRPSVSAEGKLGFRDHETFGATRPGSWSIDVNQLLYGAVDAGISRTVHVIGSERASLSATEQQVLLEVTANYMDVVLARTILDRAVNNEQRLERHLEATEDRFRLGLFTQTDVAQARARLAGARAERQRAHGQLMSMSARFRQVVGTSPEDLHEPAVPRDLPLDVTEAITLADADHPAIRQAVEAERAAWDEADLAAGDLLPTVDLVASYTQSRNSGVEHTWRNDFRIETRIVVPLYQRGLKSSQVRQARQKASALRLQVNQVRRQVEANVVSAWQALRVARAEIQAFEEEVAANTIALEGAENELRAGLRTVLDVLDAEQSLFESEVRLARARSEEVTAAYVLQSATGRLSARHLGLPVEIYDINAYHDRAKSALWGYGEDTQYADDWFD